jgi:predicted acetyltransferase
MNNAINFKPALQLATIDDYETIQNMARFYAYDMSRECGFIVEEWNFPKNGLYESHDFKKYFIDDTRKAYFIKIDNELAGFVLLNTVGEYSDTEWNMGEFFIVAKYQSKGIGKQVAELVWQRYPGKWEVSVIPENKRSLNFWRKIIADFTKNKYTEEMKDVIYDKFQPKRYILRFCA